MELLTHQSIEQREIVERYVTDTLSPEERRAFQEHYFNCEACFAQVEITERFISGIRDAAASGLLDSRISKKAQMPMSGVWSRWFQPTVAVATAASLILAATVGWFLLYTEPKLRQQLAREQQMREQAVRESQQNLNQAEEQLRLEREARAKLENQLAQQQQERSKLENQIAENRLPRNMSPGEVFPDRSEPNIPIVMLEATRDAGGTTNSLDVPRNARTFVLWIEVPSQARGGTYRLQIYTDQNRLLKTARGLKLNSYGALAVSLSAKSFQSGSYLVRLYSEGRQPTDLVGEYRLQVRR